MSWVPDIDIDNSVVHLNSLGNSSEYKVSGLVTYRRGPQASVMHLYFIYIYVSIYTYSEWVCRDVM